MPSAETVLCSIAANDFGRPPRRSRVEARAQPEGFAVWFEDELLYPVATQIARRYSPYDSRELARIILDHQIAHKYHRPSCFLYRPPKDSWRAVTVTGEGGLKAHLLALAFASGWQDTHWLLAQSETSFDAISALCGDVPSDEWKRLFFVILACSEELDYDLDALSLLHRYGLPLSNRGLAELRDALGRDVERQREAREIERKARGKHFNQWPPPLDSRLAPFEDQIAWIARAYRETLGRYRITWPPGHQVAQLECFTRCLEDRAIARGRLPTGRIRFRFPFSPLPQAPDYRWCEVDVDVFAARAAETCSALVLPKAYRSPRHQRARLFRQQIEAVACTFAGIVEIDDHTPERARRRCIHMESFLKDYVTEYERLPRGKLRPDMRFFPGLGYFIWTRHLRVEIDFDRLRERAGLSNDEAAPDSPP